MKRLYCFCFLFLFALPAFSQTTGPDVTSWIVNRTGATGYGGLPTNVQAVQYSDANVYVTCTCIPGYDIGPWPGNPNTPKNQNFLFKITRTPTVNTSSKTATPNGHIGVWTNGVSIFNAKDARSYNNAGVWNQNAIAVEGSSFDECLGHPAPNGEYHHHLNPVCLYDDKDSLHHSPIIGYAFDGFPIYGAYGYAKPDGTGGIRRMESSYRLREIADRSTLPSGTLTSDKYGPAVSVQYPLGYYIEDFEYVDGLGDLDRYNGHFCVTPEYPAGTYAYFVTIDDKLTATYPYTLGPSYYGTVPAGNTGPGSGHVTISESVLTYVPTAGGVDGEVVDSSLFSLYPNPATERLTISYSATRDYLSHIDIRDARGSLVFDSDVHGPEAVLPLSGIPEGSYFVSILTSGGKKTTKRFVK